MRAIFQSFWVRRLRDKLAFLTIADCKPEARRNQLVVTTVYHSLQRKATLSATNPAFVQQIKTARENERRRFQFKMLPNFIQAIAIVLALILESRFLLAMAGTPMISDCGK
jgi:hypothetical protein